MKAVLITGTSSGIGYQTAKEFINQGYQVFGSVRQEKDAKQLEAEFGANFVPLLFDVTDFKAVQQAAQKVESILEGRGLTGLINNAGFATSGPLMYQPLDEIRCQFEVNVIGLIAVTQAFLPLLKAQPCSGVKAGRIINMSSTSGKIAVPFVGAYTGSKHAVEGISQTLRQELQLHGIDVIIIGPGPINTPIWDKKSAHDTSRYDATEYGKPMRGFLQFLVRRGKQGYSPDVVARLIRKAVETPHPKARYAIVPNPISGWTLPSILPDRWLDRMIGKDAGLLPEQ